LQVTLFRRLQKHVIVAITDEDEELYRPRTVIEIDNYFFKALNKHRTIMNVRCFIVGVFPQGSYDAKILVAG
jgi:hypothetical protein